MNRTQHTLGPWRIQSSGIDGNTGYYKFAVSAENRREIVNTRQSVLGTTYPELEANARLIAAAPELLESCQALLKMVDELLPLAPKGCGWGTIETDMARAAITKAIGQ